MHERIVAGQGVRQTTDGHKVPIGVLVLDNNQHPIGLAEGSGFFSAGRSLTIEEFLDPRYAEHIRLCDCDWLVQFIRERQERTVPVTAEELRRYCLTRIPSHSAVPCGMFARMMRWLKGS